MARLFCKKGYSVTEILVVCVITVILFTSVMGVFVISKRFYASIMAEQELQRKVNGLMGRIIRGSEEGGNRYGLRSAVSFTVNGVSDLSYTGTDGGVRRIHLTNGDIVYDSPTQNPTSQIMYDASGLGAIAALRFWEPVGFLDHETIGVYLALTKGNSGKAATGSATTYVNVRNLPK